MATPTAFVKSNTAAILDALTAEMGIENAIGAEEDARRSAPRRVTWVPLPKGRQYAAPTQQRADMKVCHVVSATFAVHLWGKDFFDAEQLEQLLVGALFNRLSPNAYELGAGDPLGGDDTSSRGFDLVIPVTLLRIPIAAEVRQRVALTSAMATGSVSNPLGQGATPAGSVTIPQ
ncbi:MAG: hypothetical protein IT372_42545 [Polyangiaceae bacterium]|nr:hypothetical protein [Polyangiaceae bacterium]